MTHRNLLWSLAILVTLVPSLAGADVVEPPPDSCPAGSTPSSSHSGPICVPAASCATDLMCGSGETCAEVRLCVVARACGGLTPPDAGPCFIDDAVGVCAADGSCAEGTCTVRNACTSGSSSGCACNAGPGASTALMGGGGFLLFCLVVWRRLRYLAPR